jgi:hypothetical protein
MDYLATLAKRLKEFMIQPQENDTLGSFSERCRGCNTKDPLFWGLVVDTMKMLTLAELGAAFVVECGSTILLIFSQAVALESIPTEDKANAVKADPPRCETARAPPQRFIPIPKTEIGGCARSDTAHP